MKKNHPEFEVGNSLKCVKAATPEDVTTLFNVLAGEEDVSEAAVPNHVLP